MVTSTNTELKQVSDLAAAQLRLEAEVGELEERLKQKKAELRTLREELLPDLMDSVGLREFRTSEGAKVSVSRVLSVSVPRDRKPAAVAWLRNHGFDGYVKDEIAATLGKGQLDLAETATAALRELGISDVRRIADFHSGQVKALLRRWLEDGKKVDLELFGAYDRREAKIELPK